MQKLSFSKYLLCNCKPLRKLW